jgi:hypothetical protein
MASPNMSITCARTRSRRAGEGGGTAVGCSGVVEEGNGDAAADTADLDVVAAAAAAAAAATLSCFLFKSACISFEILQISNDKIQHKIKSNTKCIILRI